MTFWPHCFIGMRAGKVSTCLKSSRGSDSSGLSFFPGPAAALGTLDSGLKLRTYPGGSATTPWATRLFSMLHGFNYLAQGLLPVLALILLCRDLRDWRRARGPLLTVFGSLCSCCWPRSQSAASFGNSSISIRRMNGDCIGGPLSCAGPAGRRCWERCSMCFSIDIRTTK